MKLFKFLFKLVLLVVVLVGVAVGVVFYQLSDNSFNEPDYLKETETLKFDMNSLVSNGIKDSKETSKISIGLEEKEVNIILKSLKDDLNKKLESSKIEIRSMYVDIIESDDIKFISYLDFSGFKTSLTGEFFLSLNDNFFEVTIDNLKIGKMNFSKSTVESLITKLLKDQDLEKKLEVFGINLSLSLKTLTMKLDLLEVKDTLIGSLQDSDEYSLYQTILGVIFRVDNLISLGNRDNNIGLDVDLSSFSFDINNDIANPYYIDFDSVNTKVETLLNNGVVNSTLASSVATFITKGYYNSPSSIKDDVKDIDLSSVGIVDKETYFGCINYSDKTIKDTLVEQALHFDILNSSSFEGFKVSENVWNNYFVQGAVGSVYTFIREEDNEYKSSYFAIDGLYLDIKEDQISFYLTISINGKLLTLNFEMNSNESSGLRISSEIKLMRLGSNLLENEEIKKILEYLNLVISDEWIIIDSLNSRIDFDFTSLFVEDESLKYFINSGLFNFKTSFEEKNDEGYILISLN